MSRIVLALVFVGLLGALPLLGCGTSDDSAGGGITPGPAEFAIPLLPPAGETLTLGLKNLSTADAPVTATVYPAAGGPGAPLAVPVIPALGEIQVIVVAPPAFGWIHIETRDPATLASLPSTGFVAPYFHLEASGPRGEYAAGLRFAAFDAALAIDRDTTAVQVVNKTRDAAVPVLDATLPIEITTYDTAGVVVAGPVPVVLAANEAFLVPLAFPNFTGQVRVKVATDDPLKLEAFTMAAREEPSSLAFGLNTDPDIAVQGADLPGFFELALEYGRTDAFDYRDFVILATNATDLGQTVQIDDIRDSSGGSLLPSPRTFTLGPRETRYFATTLVNTIGMVPGEIHPFADLFGDVFLTTGIDVFRMSLIHGDGVVLTAPNFDPAFLQAYQVVVEEDRSFDTMVLGIEQETTTFAAERNWIALTNPIDAPVDVFVEAFTPGGTQYYLPTLTLPPRGRLDWSPDAIVLNGLLGIREDQNVPTDPPVAYFSLRFISNTGIGVVPRREIRGPDGVLTFWSPYATELLGY